MMKLQIPLDVLRARSGRLALRAFTTGLLWLVTPAYAQDCSLAGWTESQPQAVSIGAPPTIARYSGQCAIQVTAAGRYLKAIHPNAEPTYYARFYYYTGARAGGAIDIFQGRDGATLPIRVEHEAIGSINRLRFSSSGSGALRTADVQVNKWYAIELAWTTGSGNGALGITVTGAGVSTPIAVSPITGLNNPTQRIREIRMGWITAGGSGAINFDAFEARRDGPPGRLLRGDANGNGVINVGDAIAARNEVLGGALALGQPNCNEDQQVNIGDAICIRNLALVL
jgi:hypothetical protein